jgi:DNA-binding MarR family transcriptional regulator
MANTHVKDHVDLVLEQWARELPALDASPMAVLGRVSRLAALTEREFDAVFSRYGVNGGEFDVLAALRRSGAPFRLTPTELARALMVSSGGMTKRLKALEAAGLVRRVQSPTDGRSSDVVLTAKGRRVVEEAVAAHRANEERILGGLSERDRTALAGLLRRLLVELER